MSNLKTPVQYLSDQDPALKDLNRSGLNLAEFQPIHESLV